MKMVQTSKSPLISKILKLLIKSYICEVKYKLGVMCSKFLRSFCFIGWFISVIFSSIAQDLVPKNEDYKKWTLEQLLFTIDSGLLEEEIRLEYIEHYLQKAKKENSIDDIVIGYKKKIANLKGYAIRNTYADSLLLLANKLEVDQILGVAYDYKSAVEITSKNFETALKYALKAECFLKKTKDLYTLYEVKSSLGIIYFHLDKFEEAYQIYEETTNYHFSNKEKSYNNRKRYIIHLYSLGKLAYRLHKYDMLEALIQDGYKDILELKAHHQALETAYFSLLDGMYHFSLQQHFVSDSLLQAALPLIKQNNDFANEHLAYLYLGKNAWESGQKHQALQYFERVDSLYLKKDFINSELSEAYAYLIDYYKEDKDTEKQLYYTNTLLEISHNLQIKNKDLTDYLYKNLDAKKLEESKAQLENVMLDSKRWKTALYIMVVLLLSVLGVGMFFIFRKPKVHSLVAALEADQLSEQSIPVEVPESIGVEVILLKKLVAFEEDKGFLQKITLQELASNLSTNRTTLSQVLNEHKGGFKIYLKRLRITYAQAQIEQNPKLQQLHYDALAEEFGFGSGRSFSTAFKEITDISLSDFIRQVALMHIEGS